MKWFIFSLSWLAITVTLSIWWAFHGIEQARELSDLKKSLGVQNKITQANFEKTNRMFIWEGAFFILMLSVGGGTIIWLSNLEHQRNRLLESFFSTLTHELKTPLTSLYLKVDDLLDDFPDGKIYDSIMSLNYDVKRLDSQIEKAFNIASLTQSEGLFFELIVLKDFFKKLQENWRELNLNINVNEQDFIYADNRALMCVFRNLLENSYKHGKASEVFIETHIEDRYVKINFKDNGVGFLGKQTKLTKIFFRHKSSSGTGLGLYIVKKLMIQMKGKIVFSNPKTGFDLSLLFPKYSA